MNEKLEIGGDLQDEYDAIQAAERAEGHAGAPALLAPITDAELDGWAAQNTPDLVRVNDDDDGTPVWAFVSVRNMIQNPEQWPSVSLPRHRIDYRMH